MNGRRARRDTETQIALLSTDLQHYHNDLAKQLSDHLAEHRAAAAHQLASWRFRVTASIAAVAAFATLLAALLGILAQGRP